MNLSMSRISFLISLLVPKLCFALVSMGSPIKASDINTLRTKIDIKRVYCGLAAQTWTDSPLTKGTPIKSVHLTELRSSVASAYAAKGKPAPNFADREISRSTPIQEIHFSEVSMAIDFLECP
jgi:hypothetical protein